MLSTENPHNDSCRKGARESVSTPTYPSEVFRPDYLRRGTDFEALWLYLLKGGLDKPTRDSIGRASAGFISQRVMPALAGGISLDERDRPAFKTLRKKGWSPVANVFSDAEIAEIDHYFRAIPASVSGGGCEGHVLLKDVPPAASFAHFHGTVVCGCPPIYRVLHDERLISLASAYLGAPATIGISTVWWSYPAPGGAEGMQMFHHDRGDFRSCNLFVYLSDVDAGTGPHAFVEQTHEMEVLLPLISQRFGSDPEGFHAFWKWMEQHRKTDADVARFFAAENIKSFTGPKGTSFFEDTRGLHKGTRPTAGPRFAFEIFYSVLPKFNEVANPLRRADLDLPQGLEKDSDKLPPLVRYATRQYLV
jgi:hypothetical protein